MSIQVDIHYINQIAPYLRNFKRVGDRYNFSCCICGDSKKDKSAARGWFFVNQEINFKCYNCNAPYSFHAIIKLLNPALSKQYYLDKLTGGKSILTKKIELPKKQEVIIKSTDIDLPNAFEIELLYNYLKARKIPEKFYKDIYFAERFKEWTNTKKETFTGDGLMYEHSRIIFPFRDYDGKAFGFSARGMKNETPKYLIIKFDDTEEKIFGLDRIDLNKHIYAVEGQIDSMFIDNCVAVAGAAFNNKFCKRHKNNLTQIYDNEPRSKAIMDMLDKSIKEGYNVFIWPDIYKTKDINDLIMSGKTKEQVKEMIDANTFSGMEAKFRYNQWRKIR